MTANIAVRSKVSKGPFLSMLACLSIGEFALPLCPSVPLPSHLHRSTLFVCVDRSVTFVLSFVDVYLA